MDFTIPRPSPAKVITSAGGSVLSVTNIMSFASALMFVVTMTISFTMIFPNIDFLKNRINPFYDALSPFFVNDTGAFQRCSGTDINLCTISSDLADLTIVVNNLSNGTIVAGNFSTNVVIDANTGQTQTVVNNNTANAISAINTTASGALTLATAANTTAGGALTLAASANTTANGALSLAGNANTTAGGALSLAGAVNTTANGALSIAYATQIRLNNILSAIGSTYYVELPVNGGVNNATCGRNILTPCASFEYAATLIPPHDIDNMAVVRFGAGFFVSSTVYFPCNTIVIGTDMGTIWQVTTMTLNQTSSTSARCYLSFDYMTLNGAISLSAVGTGFTNFQVRFTNITSDSAGSLSIIGNGAFTQLIFEVMSSNGGYTSVYIQDMYISTNGKVSFNCPVTIVELLRSGFVILDNWVLGIGGLLLNNTFAGNSLYFITDLHNHFSGTLPWFTCNGPSSTMSISGDQSISLRNYNNTFGPIEICRAGYTPTNTSDVGSSAIMATTNPVHSPDIPVVATVQRFLWDNAERIYNLENSINGSQSLNYNCSVPANWANNICPSTIGSALDVLGAEQQKYLTTDIALVGSPVIGLTCSVNLDIAVGNEYVRGGGLFSRGGSGVVFYNGTSTAGIMFEFSANVFFQYSSTTASSHKVEIIIFINGYSNANKFVQHVPLDGTATSIGTDVTFSKALILIPGDYFELTYTVSPATGSTTTFTDCGLQTGVNIHPHFSLTRYTV